MARIDALLSAIARIGANGMVLASDSNVVLRFADGDKPARQATSHADLVALIEEITPRAMVAALRAGRNSQFEYAAAGVGYDLAVEVLDATAWRVIVLPRRAAAPPPAAELTLEPISVAAPPPLAAKVPGQPASVPRAPTSPAVSRTVSAAPIVHIAVSAMVPPPMSGDHLKWLHTTLALVAKHRGSDLLLAPNLPPRMRSCGALQNCGDIALRPRDVEAAVLSALSPEQRAAFDAAGELDLALVLDGVGRFRTNVYRHQHGVSGVFHYIPITPPTLAELGLPASLAKVTTYHQGMVLVTGPVGCGKTSTLAALVDLINKDRHDHILTVEDPIEYKHPSKKCVVNQREVKRDTSTFARALRAALREDPDIIVIGELRDFETISLAMSAAETGHLVLATLHTNNVIRTINRLIGVFPPSQQSQARSMMSESLRAVVSQRLLPRADGNGVALALETLFVTRAVSNLIRENRAFQIGSILQTGKAQGQVTLDASLQDLVRAGTITPEVAAANSERPEQFRVAAPGGANAPA